MVFLLALVIPVALMLLVTMMEHVERPLRDLGVGERVAATLLHVPADEVESQVSQEAAEALERHWRRQARVARLRPRRTVARW